MANTGLWEVQKTLVNTLKSSSTLTTLVSDIVDEPETNQDYPYVVVGDGTEVTDNTLRRLGYENTMTFFIYTKPYGNGWYPATQILDAMNEVLNVQKPSMDTLNVLMCKLDDVLYEKDDDKRIIHVRYRVWSQKDDFHTIL